ncbi:MAG: hypothetical protein K9N55_18290 [Phycisphaerae bacterium]|nr:hypothetical protein [Phycisphaerae bacterium]
MKLMKYLYVLCVAATLSGCGSSGMLQKKATEVVLKPATGGVLLVIDGAMAPKQFKPVTLTIRKLNQYEPFTKVINQVVPIGAGYGSNVNKKSWLLQINLPYGTYLVDNFMAKAPKQTFFKVGKLLNVRDGEMTYAGHLSVDFNRLDLAPMVPQFTLTDNFEQDMQSYSQFFPVINNVPVKLDLLY